MLTLTVGAVLTAAGLALAARAALRRRLVRAARTAALALVPLGLALAGAIGLALRVADAVGGWAADLVLRPSVWAGLALLAAAVVLYAAAGMAARRSRGAAAGSSGPRPEPAGARAVAGPGSAVRRKSQAGGGAEDFSDIEEILRKHGI
jgi:hypothetical protein